MITKGDIFYHAWVNLEPNDKSTIEFEEWHVTSVNKNGVYLTQKTSLTWGKRSSKNGDYGWLRNIPDYYRKVLKNQDYKSSGLHKSKSAAYRSVMPEMKKYKRDVLRLHSLVERKIKQFTKSKKVKL